MFQYRVHKSPLLVPILNQLNVVRTTQSYFSKIHFNVIFPISRCGYNFKMDLKKNSPGIGWVSYEHWNEPSVCLNVGAFPGYLNDWMMVYIDTFFLRILLSVKNKFIHRKIFLLFVHLTMFLSIEVHSCLHVKSHSQLLDAAHIHVLSVLFW
jgi:hypothetical protein